MDDLIPLGACQSGRIAGRVWKITRPDRPVEFAVELLNGPPVGNVRLNLLDAPDLLSVVRQALRCVRTHAPSRLRDDLGRLRRALQAARTVLLSIARTLLFVRRKRRHKVKDFQAYALKLDLFRVQTARDAYRYEIDISERQRYDFAKIGTVRLEDTERLVKLVREVDAYVNGRR